MARQNSRRCPGSAEAFAAAYDHPELGPIATERNVAPADQLAAELKAFALSHEADAVGIAPMDPLYIFEGYTIEEPWVIVLALAHNYERLREVPSDETNGVGVTDIGDQYARGTRASYALANWIRSQGYSAHAYPGPIADALLLVPPAIARISMGIRTASPWMEASQCIPVVAAASEPIPISSRRPLIAIKALHALCSRIKDRLVSPMIHDRPFLSFRAPVSTTAICSEQWMLHHAAASAQQIHVACFDGT